MARTLATVTITVNSVNDPPVANAGSATTDEDTAVDITLVGSDIDGDPLTYAIATQPAHGTLSGSGANRTYTPAANYHGPDSFAFVANDGTVDSAAATVSITVTSINDDPVAVDDSTTTDQNTAVTIDVLANDSDVDGDSLVVDSRSHRS